MLIRTGRLLVPATAVLILAALTTPALSTSPTEPPTLCFGREATILGTDGNDELLGTRRADVIVAGAGDDVVRARGGDDLVCTGDGDDHIHGAAGSDSIDGGDGSDTISYAGAPTGVVVDLDRGTAKGGHGSDRIVAVENVVGSPGDDELAGNDDGNRLVGGRGDDVFVGSAGGDTLEGGPGRDSASYEGSAAAVTIDLRSGTAEHAGGADRLAAVEDVTGSAFDDFLVGNGKDNALFGGAGDDVLVGRSGSDVLDGGAGTDVAQGGPDIDGCAAEAEAACEPLDPGDTKNCSDFLSQDHAQAWFEAYFPVWGDVARLDADGNGRACESLRGGGAQVPAPGQT